MNYTGKKIKQLRQAMDWSQTDVATKLNISTPAFSKIETGITDISLSRIKQVAELFSVEPASLVSGDNSSDIKHMSDAIIKLNKENDAFVRQIAHLQGKLIITYEELRTYQKP